MRGQFGDQLVGQGSLVIPCGALRLRGLFADIVLGADVAALDTRLAVMRKADDGTAAGDLLGTILLGAGERRDLGFKLFAFGLRRAAVVLAELVKLRFKRVELGLILAAKRNGLRIDALRIETELRQIVEDARYWVDHQSFSRDELAVRFHHRLVLAHPFPNGNGRWSRLAADMLITQQSGARFSWGRANLQNAGDVRRFYIDALHAADAHDLTPLIAFARS